MASDEATTTTTTMKIAEDDNDVGMATIAIMLSVKLDIHATPQHRHPTHPINIHYTHADSHM